MRKRKSGILAALLTGASFTGYNIGSGFATGTEGLQFFASWGNRDSFVSIAVAALFAMLTLCAIYITGFEQKFNDGKTVYRFFCGNKLGAIFDIYIYLSMLLVTLTMMSGAGATINQYFGVPVYVGSVIMGIMCIITSLLGLDRLRIILGYLSVVVLAFILFCAGYVIATGREIEMADSTLIEAYVASGDIMRISAFRITSPVESGLSSAGLVISSGFAWASVTGTLCKSRREAALSGILSSLCFYVSTSIVVFLILISIPQIAGNEVPMLTVLQTYLPKLAPLYSVIIILAIFSTISGRLFLIGERYGQGNRKRTLIIVTAITVFAAAGASFIPFSRISNFMFTICGAAGIALSLIVIIRFFVNRNHKREIKA